MVLTTITEVACYNIMQRVEWIMQVGKEQGVLLNKDKGYC